MKYIREGETKEQRVLRKQLESLSMERNERSLIGKPSSSVKTAERMLYDQPINKQASKEFKH